MAFDWELIIMAMPLRQLLNDDGDEDGYDNDADDDDDDDDDDVSRMVSSIETIEIFSHTSSETKGGDHSTGIG